MVVAAKLILLLQLGISLASWLFAPDCPLVVIQLTLGGVYLFSGLSKLLTLNSFSSWTFAPMHAVACFAARVLCRLLRLSAPSPSALQRMRLIVSAVGVCGEALAGAAFVCAALWPPTSPQSFGGIALGWTSLFVFGMHSYSASRLSATPSIVLGI